MSTNGVNELDVSVVIAVHNEERFVRSAVVSMLTQTYRPLEIIVVDDGSTDNTAAILGGLADQDARVRVVSEGKIGAITAFNRGASLARGKYIAWLGGDDVSMHTRLERQVRYLEDHPDAAVVSSSMMLIDEDGKVVGSVRYPTQSKEILAALPASNPIAAPAATIRKSAYEAVGGCRAPFVGAEDFDLWLRLAERYDLANLADFLVGYRVHDQQVSTRSFEQQALSTIAVRVSSHARRGAGPDPFAVGGPITRQRLLEAGLCPSDLDAMLGQEYAARAATLVAQGRARPAWQLLNSLAAPSSARRYPPFVVAMLALSRARIHWALGERREAFKAGLVALRADAVYVIRAAGRGVRSAVSDWHARP